MNRRRERLRLKDLAVVLAVIVVLSPVLAAGLKRSREMSMQVQCTQNLKTIGVACEMYQADWDEVLVPYGSPFGWPPNKMWYDLVNAYISPGSTGIGKTLKCPVPINSTAFAADRSYGINQACGGWMPGGTPVVVSLNQVRFPQSTIRIADVEWLSQGGTAFAAQPRSDAGGPYDCRFPERHSGKGNVLWIDGHVSAMTRAQYNMRDSGAYYGQIWLRLEGPKPALPN